MEECFEAATYAEWVADEIGADEEQTYWLRLYYQTAALNKAGEK